MTKRKKIKMIMSLGFQRNQARLLAFLQDRATVEMFYRAVFPMFPKAVYGETLRDWKK